MVQLTPEEKDQKLLDIAFEPDCICEADKMKEPLLQDHHAGCPWRLWAERMQCWEREEALRDQADHEAKGTPLAPPSGTPEAVAIAYAHAKSGGPAGEFSGEVVDVGHDRAEKAAPGFILIHRDALLLCGALLVAVGLVFGFLIGLLVLL